MNREQRRANGVGPVRPTDDLRVARVPGSTCVLVGLDGSGYVRLTLEQARELGFALLETAADQLAIDGG